MLNQTFADRLQLVVDKYYNSVNHFAVDLGTTSSRIANYIKEGKSPQVDFVKKILEKIPEVSPNWLLMGEGDMLRPAMIRDAAAGKDIITVTVDAEGNELPVYVPIHAQAGYLTHINDPAFISTLPAVSAPFLRGKSMRAFEVDGDSMEPTFYERDVVFASQVYSLEDIRNGRVYVIVSRDEGIVLKRIHYFRGEDDITLESDNRAYTPFKMKKRDIMELWYFRRRVTAQAPPPSNLEERIFSLERDVFSLMGEIQKLRK